MRSDEDAINIDHGPNVKKMYRMGVSYLADREGVPMNVIYQRALDLLMGTIDWTNKELKDYYGLRAEDLDVAMKEMKKRGLEQRLENRRKVTGRGRKAA